MRALDEGRYDAVKNIEERLANGETKHPLTNEPLENQLAVEDRPVQLEPEDDLWVFLFDHMHSAVPPDGTLPVPSEEDLVFDRLGIRHPDNREFVRLVLRDMWAGRAEGMSARFERGDRSPRRPGKKG